MAVDPETRHRVMASIRKRDTAPELRVRRALHRKGLRYRLHMAALPGTPDIVFPTAKLVVLVHGCFWHQHEGCPLARRPRGNTVYWEPKLARNVARDRAVREQLAAAGWRVVTVWECQTKDEAALQEAVGTVARIVDESRTERSARAVGSGLR